MLPRLARAGLGALLRGGCQAATGTEAAAGPAPERLLSLALQPAWTLPSQQQQQLQQAALFRSLLRSRLRNPSHPHPHPHPHPNGKHHPGVHPTPPPPRSLLRRALGTLGKALAVTVLAVPLAGVAGLVVAGWEDADAWEMVLAVPRAGRALWWGVHSTARYKGLASRHPDRKSEAYLQELSLLHEEASQRLLLVCQGNGGVYIKAGQLAVALRAVPPEYRRTLEVLQDRVPPRPFSEIDKALAHELGAPAEDLFSSFEQTATAAASLAQVHRAWLKDGTAVAVKVQYPGLDSAVMADVASMVAMARVGHWLFPDVNLVWLFEELQGKLSQELDFRIEARNATHLAECMAGRRGVAVPRLVPELCSRKVLTMEWVEGCKVSDEERLQQMGLAPRDVGLQLLEAFGDMMFVHGFVHGDPHPGNILVRADWGSQGLLSRLAFGRRPRPQLVLLDHGLYITLPQEMRQQYCQMWCAFVLNDKDTAAQAATALGGETAGRILPEMLRPRNWSTVSREERRKFRQEAGLNSFADLGSVLEQAPRPLLDTLRITGMVRHTASQLGATIADRLRINATAAFHGMELHRPPPPSLTAEVPQGTGEVAAAGEPAVLAPQRRVWLWLGRREEPTDAPAAAAPAVVVAVAAAAAAAEKSRGRAKGRGRGAITGEGGGVQYFGVLQSRAKRIQLVARIWVMRGMFWAASVLQGLVERVMPGTTLLA